jgi:phosphoserine phosphatase
MASVPYMPSVVDSIKAMKAMGVRLATVSTGISVLVDRVARELGFCHKVSNRLHVIDGILTGGVDIYVSEVSGPLSKARWIKRFLAEQEIDPVNAAAVGDSSGDIPMFLEVGNPILIPWNEEEKERISGDISNLTCLSSFGELPLFINPECGKTKRG